MFGTSPPPTRCAECGALLADALVLTCGHDLCLDCASQALRQTQSPSGRAVRCLLCGGVTELCADAANALHAESGGNAVVPVDVISNGAPSKPTSPRQQHRQPAHQPQQAYHQQHQLRPLGHQQPIPPAQVPQVQIPIQVVGSGGTTPPSLGSGLPAPRRPSHGGPLSARGGSTNTPRSGGAVGSTMAASLESTPRAVLPGTPRGKGRADDPWMTARCPEHPHEAPTYFCATCESLCVCSDCVVHGKHRGHEVMRTARAFEALRGRAGHVLDEALALEDDFAVVMDKLAWRRKDISRAAARGRASVRSAFARVRSQLVDRETELLDSLDTYESDSLERLDQGSTDHENRLAELRRLQESLRSGCRGNDAVAALNAYAAAKAAIASLREAFRQDELAAARSPDDFVNLAGSARTELDLHAEGLASLEEAVASLCERGVETTLAPARRGDAQAVAQTPSPAPPLARQGPSQAPATQGTDIGSYNGSISRRVNGEAREEFQAPAAHARALRVHPPALEVAWCR